MKTQYELEQDVSRLHRLFNNKKRYDCFDGDVHKLIKKIPSEPGLIVFFENGEKYQNGDRIVFVGEAKSFKERVNSIYSSGGSAKIVTHIRDALGNRYKKPASQTEAHIYIQKNISFSLLPMDKKEERVSLNKKILTTLSICASFKASENWLGNSAPKEYEKITESRLWAVKYTFGKECLTEADLNEIEELVKANQGI